nr:hypothetical protein [Tanacetum cinerariifolium]
MNIGDRGRLKIQPIEDTVLNCGSKRTDPHRMIRSFNPTITNRTSNRSHINTFPTEIPSRGKTITESHVNLFLKKSIPPCFKSAIGEKAIINLTASTFYREKRVPRDKFGEVSLSKRLARSHGSLVLAKVNESLGFLEYYIEGEIWVCGVWTKKDGVNKPFTKIYTAKVEGKLVYSVLGFRKNGEVVLEMADDNDTEYAVEVYEPSSRHINGVGINGKYRGFSIYTAKVEGKLVYSVLGFRNNGEVVLEMADDNDTEYAVKVYEPSSRHINGVGINGKYRGFSVRSYTETLPLLHESNSIIH